MVVEYMTLFADGKSCAEVCVFQMRLLISTRNIGVYLLHEHLIIAKVKLNSREQ